jgi:hypothetical protein
VMCPSKGGITRGVRSGEGVAARRKLGVFFASNLLDLFSHSV